MGNRILRPGAAQRLPAILERDRGGPFSLDKSVDVSGAVMAVCGDRDEKAADGHRRRLQELLVRSWQRQLNETGEPDAGRATLQGK